MRGPLRREALFSALLVIGCSDTKETNASKRSPDAGAPADASEVSLSQIGSRDLDRLDVREAERVCEEDFRRTDFCMQTAIALDTKANCETSLSECRGAIDGGRDAGVACNGVQFGPPGTCAVTVDDYFGCVADWNSVVTCDEVGLLIEAPAACSKVVAKCPRLGPSFFRRGATLPCADAGASAPPRQSDDLYGYDGCRPPPARFVVLGDSIAACHGLPREQCGPDLIADYVRTRYSPSVVVESHAADGAFTEDVPAQARLVAGGPGHVAVWVWVIGNDIVANQTDYAQWTAAWNDVFSYFTDRTRFPDGATFMLNTQYSPFDECVAAWDPSNTTAEIEPLLRRINQKLFLDVAEQRPDTVAIDEYPDWLGHGAYANVRGCPHCGSDNTRWLMIDGLHPNSVGEAHIVSKWEVAMDRLYGPACHGG
jgi:hypothetical protein